MKEYKGLGHLKTYKMKLTTLSPIFIGGGEKLSNLDFIFDINTGYLNLIDESKFSKYLISNNMTNNFISFVSGTKNAKLFEWFKQNHIQTNTVDLFKNKYKYPKADLKALNDINLFIKNTKGNPYIPGTSIKGVIKTAILQKKLNEHPEIKDKYATSVIQALKSKNVNVLKKIEKEIEEDLICLNFPEFKNKFEISDVFRGIEITDSKELSISDLKLYKKTDYSFGKDKPHSIPLYRECLKSYIDVEFYITLDINIAKCLNIDIDYILKALKDYAESWHSLISVFGKDADRFNLYFPNDEEKYDANFCIGGGAGFLTKTISYSLYDNKNEAINAVKKYLDLSFVQWNKVTRQKEPTHKHEALDKAISPRTLKLADDNGDFVNLGWCNISVVE